MEKANKRPNSSNYRKNLKTKEKENTQNKIGSKVKNRPDSTKLKTNDQKGKLLNTNMSIAFKNYTKENQETQSKAKYKRLYPEILLNNPKRFIDLINDNCFHLEMNLKLLGFDEEFIKESQAINNMTSAHNPFLKSNTLLMTAILYFLLLKAAKGIESSNLSNLVVRNFNNLQNDLIDNPLFESEEDLKLNFKFCFPATTLKELKDFKELSFNLIKKLEKIGILEQNTLLSKTILDSASGERLITFLRVFSDRMLILTIKAISKNHNLKFEEFYVSNLNINRIFGKEDKERIYPNANLGILCNNAEGALFADIKKKSIILSIVKAKDKLMDNSEVFLSSQEKWKKQANKLTCELNAQEAENEQVYRQLKNLKKNDTSVFSELASLDRAPKLENYKFFFEQITKIKNEILDSSEFVDNLSYIEEKDADMLFE